MDYSDNDLDLPTLWEHIRERMMPTPVVDVSLTYERIYADIKRNTYTNAILAASIRTAWVFAGECNRMMFEQFRVPLNDTHRAIDEIDKMVSAMERMARTYDCAIVHKGWVVWTGEPRMLSTWKEKLK